MKYPTIVTEVSIQATDNPTPPILAFARIVLNDVLVISGIRIVSGRERIFISFPQERRRDKTFNICFPISNQLLTHVTEAVLAAFEAEIKKKETTIL